MRVEAQIVFSLDETLSRSQGLQRAAKSKRYHGGSLDDEVAALFSLSLGIRLKPGYPSREFMPGGDPRGAPRATLGTEPLLLTSAYGKIIPRSVREQSLNDDVLVKHLPSLEPNDAFAVVRAGRLYQDALWIAESQPELSWLMFVSAVETAANHWRSAEETPRERLHASKPKLEHVLTKVGGETHADQVAGMIADSLGSTRKFVAFLLEFAPAPPDKRPPEWARHSWNRRALGGDFRRIYRCRSRALHDGTPFPFPMCMPPMMIRVGERAVASERPEGEGVYLPAAGVRWTKGDLPMHLHTFEYIVQRALCKWWESMIAKTSTAGGGCAT